MCRAIIKKGRQCLRRGNGPYCFQHRRILERLGYDVNAVLPRVPFVWLCNIKPLTHIQGQVKTLRDRV
jgi:hypothetical protein